MMDKTERIARQIAYWHGQKMLYRHNGESHTVASKAGFGHWGHSADDYADGHWPEYVAAAEAVITELEDPPPPQPTASSPEDSSPR